MRLWRLGELFCWEPVGMRSCGKDPGDSYPHSTNPTSEPLARCSSAVTPSGHGHALQALLGGD